MNPSLKPALIFCLASCFPGLSAFAGGSGEAFNQAVLAHEQATSAALEPVNRDYKRALEKMQADARASNDVDLLARVQQELDKLAIKTPSVAGLGRKADFIGKWDSLLFSDGTSDILDFLPDGTWTAKTYRGGGTWVLADGQIVVNFNSNRDWHDHYDLPVQDGVLLGHNAENYHMQLTRHGTPIPDEIKSEVVGLWKFCDSRNNVSDVSLNSDGSFQLGGKRKGYWRVGDKRLYIKWDENPDWHDIYDLPVSDNKLQGQDSANGSVSLTRSDTM